MLTRASASPATTALPSRRSAPRRFDHAVVVFIIVVIIIIDIARRRRSSGGDGLHCHARRRRAPYSGASLLALSAFVLVPKDFVRRLRFTNEAEHRPFDCAEEDVRQQCGEEKLFASYQK
jgi:hypothetical protein